MAMKAGPAARRGERPTIIIRRAGVRTRMRGVMATYRPCIARIDCIILA